MTKSDGSTAAYYELPKACTELQDLISHRNMNAQIGEVFRACYRYGLVSHSDMLRDAKKMRFYADAEIKRLEALSAAQAGWTAESIKAAALPKVKIEWPTEQRIDAIGQNGGTGEHYSCPDCADEYCPCLSK